MTDLVCVDPKNVAAIWPQARGFIKSAIERTGLSEFSAIEHDVLCGDQLLWLIISDHIEAAGTTHLIKTNGVKVLVISALGGVRRDRWLPLLASIERYASAEGCKSVRIYGRKGWLRVLKNYRVEHVILERQI